MNVGGFVSVLLFSCAATGVIGFTVTTSKANVRVKENEGTALTCEYSADFGSDARIEWKFKDAKGSQMYVYYESKITETFSDRVEVYGGKNLRFSKATRKDNGVYICEVTSTKSNFGQVEVLMTVLVPTSAPVCRIPPSVTTGRTAVLTCYDSNGSPPPTYKWYKDGTLLPIDPSKTADFKNFTYKLNPESGKLEFPQTLKADAGMYSCEAVNDAGPPQRCKAMKMDVRDINTGGIVAGVIVGLLLLALLIFGIWYAKKKGYLPQRSESKPKPNVVYQPPSLYGGDDDDGDFKQKSSFVV